MIYKKGLCLKLKDSFYFFAKMIFGLKNSMQQDGTALKLIYIIWPEVFIDQFHKPGATLKV